MEVTELSEQNIQQLRALARSLGVASPTVLSKAELIQAITDVRQSGTPQPVRTKRGRPAKSEKQETPVHIEQAAPPAPAESIAETDKSTESLEQPELHEKKYIRRSHKQQDESPSQTNNTVQETQTNTQPAATNSYNRSNDRRMIRPEQNNRSSYRSTQGKSDYQRTNYSNNNAQRTNNGKSYSNYQNKPENTYYNKEYNTSNPAVPDLLNSGECGECLGILDIHTEGYGFLRNTQFKFQNIPDTRDVYVSIAQIRKFNLKTGDAVKGKTRPVKEGEKYLALLYLTEVNGEDPEIARQRVPFEDLVPIYPDERLRLESDKNRRDLALRIIDLISPVGKGQRSMIVAPPKAGKTVLLKKLANAISDNYPEVELIVLLIDERPEEVTDMQRSINGDVIYSTFDELPENHARIAELVLERAKRLVEQGRDVVILLDSLTRLARAYNLTIPPTGRTLSGGLDPGALHKPKKFFGAARNIEGGGSLTIIATALVETGSRMDEVIFEEFKGTGNMEIRLDRKLQEKRVFPAIDLNKSSTRREDLLMTQDEFEGMLSIRKLLSTVNSDMATEQLIAMLERTESNVKFLQNLKGWLALLEKEGYQMTK